MSSPLHPALKEYLRKSYIAGAVQLLISFFGTVLFLIGYFVDKKSHTFTSIFKGLLTYMVLFGSCAFYGLREIITAPKRYNQLDWVLKSIAPIEMQALLSYKDARKF